MTTPDCGLLSNPSTIRRDRFDALHPDGQRLINGWVTRGSKKALECHPASYFEAFIYLWFGLNGWGACVAETDTDGEWVEAVASDLRLSQTFQGLLDHDPEFRSAVRAFADLWPIFKSSEIRRKGIRVPPHLTRQERVQAYLDKDLTVFQPSCWKRHNGQPPLDWAHTLKTLYRVRCNLFHGGKTLDSENDRVIVEAACLALALFLRKAKLFD
jgi:hypothetical protein